MASFNKSIQAVILDVDGVVIDSEPFWRESEIESFARCGLRLTDEECMLTTGMRIQEVTRFWYARKPWKGPPPEELAGDILRGVIERIRDRGVPMPGLYDTIRLFQTRHLRLALASSSAESLIDTVVDRLHIRDFFDAICSAENEARGKPYPDVYLTAAAKLGLAPERCLAVEDSIAGVTAAKAAGMKCIAVPLPELRGDPCFGAANSILDSLVQINDKLLDSLEETEHYKFKDHGP
jgi:mannitol-1-/sugar-/sorbitol-6-/2-deoxyglucose-6-phosphatase